jgi:multidrug efflux pump subunit AcrA (membrane-fusion protein)
VSTTPVVRTDLISVTQVSGSLGYAGSYAIVNPQGTSAVQLTQAEQAVTQAENALAADETSASDTEAKNSQSVGAAEAAVTNAENALAADAAKQAADCAGAQAASPGCAQDGQKVAQDEAAVGQAEQNLASAELGATSATHQDQAKLTADNAQVQNAEAALANDEQNAVNGGTTYTSLPAVGQVIAEDQALYASNGVPSLLLYGATPAWRDFRPGMADGPDVGELTQDLRALGYGADLAPSDHFSAATAAAVQRWQATLGLPATGVILLGQVFFEPGPLRVTAVTPQLGQSVSPGPVLTATGTARVVTVALSVAQEYLVKVGDAVSVVMPDGTTTVAGHVTAVSTVAQAPAGGSNSGPTVNVTITLDNPAAAGNLDQAPVNVNITTAQANNVLAVPINALLALEGGGDGVDVVAPDGTVSLVGVQTGLFSNTLVQISGPGIGVGTRVEVPSA